MITRLRKWGNSLGLRIPKKLAEEVEVGEGTPVRVETRKGALMITPVREPRYSLDELLAGIKPSNLHAEVEFGEPLGREAW